MVRTNWNKYFIQLARIVASRSTCPRASVGAVIVKNNRIISTGYNGAPSGEAHCDEVGCLMINNHCERTVHAETNAVAQAARFGISVDGATLYCWSNRNHTDTPYEGLPDKKVASCIKCGQVMKAAGIVRVVEGELND